MDVVECQFPHYKPSTAYQYGCRCVGCVSAHRQVMARYRSTASRTCNVEGCGEPIAPVLHARRCVDHLAPPGAGRTPTPLEIQCWVCPTVFHRRPAQRPRYHVCPPCRLRARSLLRRSATLGLGPDVARRLLLQALEGCAICGVGLRLDAAEGRGTYAIDHDHAVAERQTAESVRGVLCGGCNTALGGVERFERLGLLARVTRYMAAA